MSRIAIMQGRLVPPEAGRFQSFPRERWRDEFALAAQAGLDAIEWIYDQYGEDANPIVTSDGIAELKSLSQQHSIAVVSVCADYFMDRPLVRTSDAELQEILEKLHALLDRCAVLGIERIVLPFVDHSRIENADETAQVINILKGVLPKAEARGVELHLETSLGPRPFAALLDRLPYRWLRANYDSGNSSSLGYDPVEEFAAYGSRIGSVHIKDRVRGGGTVPLGTGDADLNTLFEELEKIEYSGDYILQVAREKPGNEVEWTKQNRAYVLGLLGAHSHPLARSRR